MYLFDTIYFKVFKAYKDRFNSDTPEIFAISYLVLMVSMHVLVLLKILNLFGIPTNLNEISKTYKIVALVALYVVFAVRYYLFFTPETFEKENSNLHGYKSIILYSFLFFALFFVLILYF